MASFLLMLAAAASIVKGCEIPTEELPNTITEEFAIQVQNPAFPEIHNRLYNIWSSGGGDQHPFLSPAGNSTDELTLVDGVITMATVVPTIRAVINGEYTETDNTTKLFMTERGDPRAIFHPIYSCNPDTDELQTELAFVARALEGEAPGGHICVRSASGERHEFRWSPAGNPAEDPERPCMPVNLVVYRS
ncbi:uncharacterized protein PgNI_04428 [Pyricularia grisea]|uniref:DUF7909 domain-containing protein n=1 Tax=Pyricularia grisea TaxID=148305 RepID=A0A6P8BAV0_PYRGI|nr:uncharacterized protein PgNI_04428 [Pyricularia grisea]TLD12955.1 hypothetical protein PgNI_04428 [Pyricularia grisea]